MKKLKRKNNIDKIERFLEDIQKKLNKKKKHNQSQLKQDNQQLPEKEEEQQGQIPRAVKRRIRFEKYRERKALERRGMIAADGANNGNQVANPNQIQNANSKAVTLHQNQEQIPKPPSPPSWSRCTAKVDQLNPPVQNPIASDRNSNHNENNDENDDEHQHNNETDHNHRHHRCNGDHHQTYNHDKCAYHMQPWPTIVLDGWGGLPPPMPPIILHPMLLPRHRYPFPPRMRPPCTLPNGMPRYFRPRC